MKNVILIDIDSERDEPILIKKPEEGYHSNNLDDVLMSDSKHLTYATLYMASLLSEENERLLINSITQAFIQRKNELDKNSKTIENPANGEEGGNV
jgi:hypothetical protein